MNVAKSMNWLPFVGRQEALNAFYGLMSTHSQNNVLYIHAEGGMGKTRLLREFIRGCRCRPRWHVCPPESTVDPLIDFYEQKNRFIGGLRQSIIDRLGREYFTEFETVEARIQMVKAELNTQVGNRESEVPATIVALQRLRDDLFFRNLQPALRGRQVALFFDTFELVSFRRAGRWLRKEFLPRAEGCLIVVAGRPPIPDLPANTQLRGLEPWSYNEFLEYFEKRNWDVSEREATALYRCTLGLPLLTDMLMYFRNLTLLDVNDLVGARTNSIEQALVDRLIRVMKPEHLAILDMAFLTRHYDSQIFALRQGGKYPAYEGITDYDTLCSRLLKSELNVIVKYHPENRTLSLHDEVQRMIIKHAPSRDKGMIEDLREELYNVVVKDWYPRAIQEARSEKERSFLIADQIGYEIEHDLVQGLALYEQQIQRSRCLGISELDEVIWGEIEDLVRSGSLPGREYELCYPQAEWLWATNQFEAAADLYGLIIATLVPSPANVLRKLDSLAARGHALMAMARYDESLQCFEEGLKLASMFENTTWLGLFQQNKGQLLQTIYEWGEAERYFKQAVETARYGQNKETLAVACLYLGRLQSLQGHHDQAILNCERAVALRREVLKDAEIERVGTKSGQNSYYESAMVQPSGYYSNQGVRTRVASAYLWLAESYGHANEYENALHNFHIAETHLPTDAEYRFRCEIEYGIGNVMCKNEMGVLWQTNVTDASRSLSQAYDRLSNALMICRQYGLDPLLPKILNGIAHVFVGARQVEGNSSDHVQGNLKVLADKLAGLLLPEEDFWRDRTGLLREQESYANLTVEGKAQRLFEVSSLEAERFGDYNSMCDSLIQASEIALNRGRFADVRVYAMLANSPNRLHQQTVFLALMELVLANLDLVEGRIDQALDRYSRSFPIVARGGGNEKNLLRHYLERLDDRLRKMPVDQAEVWCDALIQQWTQRRLHESHPDLVRRVWKIRNRLTDS